MTDKGDKNSLIAYHPGIGIKLKQTNRWRDRVALALKDAIPETQTEIVEAHERESRERVSEFREKKEWMRFEDFKTEVRNLYSGQGDVQSWYHEKKKNYIGKWPSHPNEVYQNKGWRDWSSLVGKENHLKKWMSFADFKTEVRNLYPGQGDVKAWYKIAKKKYQKKWPTHPDRIYKELGWVDWSELVGRENHLKKEYLSFEVFQAEVKALYPGQGDVQAWYKIERKSHIGKWPSRPYTVYKNIGWVGWSELVGRENRLKKIT